MRGNEAKAYWSLKYVNHTNVIHGIIWLQVIVLDININHHQCKNKHEVIEKAKHIWKDKKYLILIETGKDYYHIIYIRNIFLFTIMAMVHH